MRVADGLRRERRAAVTKRISVHPSQLQVVQSLAWASEGVDDEAEPEWPSMRAPVMRHLLSGLGLEPVLAWGR